MKIVLITAVVALLAVIAVGLYVTDFTAYLGNNPQYTKAGSTAITRSGPPAVIAIPLMR
jgi:uncharacterized protein YneF (UPF0154 family)